MQNRTFLLLAVLLLLLPSAFACGATGTESTPQPVPAEIFTDPAEENDMEQEKLYCIAQSDEEALAVAEAYGLTFTGREGIIAYFISETETPSAELIRAGLEKGLPPVSIVHSRDFGPVSDREKRRNPASERKLP